MMTRSIRRALAAEVMASILSAVFALGCSNSSQDNQEPGAKASAGGNSPGTSKNGSAVATTAAGSQGATVAAISGAGTQAPVGAPTGGMSSGSQGANAGGAGNAGPGTGTVAATRLPGGDAGRAAIGSGGSATVGNAGGTHNSVAGAGVGTAKGGAASGVAGRASVTVGGQATSSGGRANTGKAGAANGGTTTTTSSGGSVAGSSSSTGGDVIANIVNGGFWNDTSGKRIEAHGGGFILVDGTWYWIGEDKSGNSGGFKAVNCYSSADLEHWKFENAIITKSTATELTASDRIVERPKVIYNDTTKQYVMWLHWEGQNYAEAKAGVFYSSTVCGNYTFKSAFRPNNNMSRDDTLFKDDDGKAYFFSAANENADMAMYLLSDDYLSVAKQVTTLWPGSKREAPALFKHEGRYFFITSACTGWDPNQAAYASSTSITGSWSSLQNIADSTTYDTQSTYVIPVVGSKTTTYVYAGDRWQDPDLASSKYIWLPIKMNGTKLSMDYYAKWQLNLTTGEWSTNVNDGFVSQKGWKLISADSEETQEEDGSATRAFDDSDSTFWHTAYTGTAPKHPHEIKIDLGATVSIKGMRCLPRQDKDNNGIIADYEFYASEDPNDWGTAVAKGTFDSTRNEHIVNFPTMNAHYIRLVALSEIEGGAWTSLAELDLVPAK